MTSAETIDFGNLGNPIDGENPAGISLRYDGVYDSIQEARRAEDDLPMGEWQRDIKAADWAAVIEMCVDALANKSKDLQIAVWLTEALVKEHSFAGLRDGLRALRELHENFWDHFFPEIEDGDLEFRAGPLEWLNQKLPDAIRNLPLVGGDEAYSWNRWEESQSIDNLGRQNLEAMQVAIAEGKISGEQFNKSVEVTPRNFYETLFEDLSQARAELSKFEGVVDEKFGRDAPSLLGVRKSLDDCHGLIDRIVKTKRQQDPTYREESAESASDGGEGAVNHSMVNRVAASGGLNWSSEPTSREEAFQRLAIIAAYLKRVEPQHPVSYLLERAVRWTQMPLEEWLNEVVQNDEVLSRLRDTLGIKGWSET